MNRVVATNRKRVPVSGNNPNVELGTRNLQPGSDGRSSSVNGMKSKRIHVVRKPARAPDPGDEHEIFAAHPEFGEHRLDGGKNRVISAAWAPADFLVCLEVFFRVSG